MTTLDELIERDNVRAAWFWIDSINVGPYAEEEKFDAVFTRDTGLVVGGGERQRRTLYVQGITTHKSMSRRENGGRMVRPDLTATLAEVIADAHTAAQYDTFAEWADDQRDMSGSYRDALIAIDEWNTDRARHAAIMAWLGPVPACGASSGVYDLYVQAAQQYVSEH